jgi:hypothetical protein
MRVKSVLSAEMDWRLPELMGRLCDFTGVLSTVILLITFIAALGGREFVADAIGAPCLAV